MPLITLYFGTKLIKFKSIISGMTRVYIARLAYVSSSESFFVVSPFVDLDLIFHEPFRLICCTLNEELTNFNEMRWCIVALVQSSHVDQVISLSVFLSFLLGFHYCFNFE